MPYLRFGYAFLYCTQLPSCRGKVKSKQGKKSRSEDAKLSKIPEEVPSTKDDGRRSSPPGADPTRGSSSSILPTAMLGIVLSSLLCLAVRHHVRLSRPLEHGSVLLRGQWKSRCGIFESLPARWLDALRVDRMLPSCEYKSSSILELGWDGTLRYHKKDAHGRRKEAWSVAIGDVDDDDGECSDGECAEDGVTFVSDEYNNWYAVMGQTRKALRRDVIRDFCAE